MSDAPSRQEIMDLARKVQETAAKVRGKIELDYVAADSPKAGAIPDDEDHQFGIGPDGRILGTAADWAALKTQYDWVPELFARYLDPEPGNFDSLIKSMEATALALYNKASGVEPVGEHIERAKAHLGNWSAFAAETFHANYIVRIPTVAKNQAYVAGTLQHAMIANKEIFVNARKDLRSTAKQTIVALEAITGSGGGEKVALALSVVSSVAAIAAGIASIPLTGGATLAGAGAIAGWSLASAVSGGLSVAAGTVERPKETDLGADTVDGVLLKMVTAINDIDLEIYHQERKIVDVLSKDLDIMTTSPGTPREPSSRDGFLAPRPALIAASRHESVMDDFLPPVTSRR